MAYHPYKSYKNFTKIRQCDGTQRNEPSLILLAHSVRMYQYDESEQKIIEREGKKSS